MKETHFIQQNKAKWSEFERVLNDSHKDPDKLHDVFIQITDDLSHARTFYPSRSVRAYLNGVAQLIFTDLYNRKKSPLSRLRYFFTDELPQVVYESRWSFFWALFFFVLSFAIGYFSSMRDPEFLRTILGDSYVDMTVENIKKGDPMAVYKSSGRFDMTFGIMENNMRVTLMYFMLGIFAGIGSVAMMMYNGIMLGSFLQFFTQNKLTGEANLTVWMHGTLEISAIVIGTAAGITMGRGLLFPGTYTRLQAFQMSARRAIKIMVGVMVMLFFAAIIEGNLTRHTGAGDVFRGGFIAINVIIILFYYGFLPFYKAKKGFKEPLREAQIPPDNFASINYFKIKSAGEIFGETFLFFKRYMKQYLWTSILLAFAFCGAIFLLGDGTPDEILQLDTNPFSQYLIFTQFYMNENVAILPLINGLVYATMAYVVYRLLLSGEVKPVFNARHEVIQFLKIATVTTLLLFGASVHEFWTAMFLLVAFPFMALWMYLMYRDNYNILNGIRHAWWLMGSGTGLSFGTYYVMLLTGYLFFAFLNSAFLWLYMWFVGWNLSFLSDGHFDQTIIVITALLASFTLFINFMLLFTACGFLFYSLLEINEANSLIQKIKNIGFGKKIQGLARE
jgi:uncharacterized membrane protein SpoIIM required for sporulation